MRRSASVAAIIAAMLLAAACSSSGIEDSEPAVTQSPLVSEDVAEPEPSPTQDAAPSIDQASSQESGSTTVESGVKAAAGAIDETPSDYRLCTVDVGFDEVLNVRDQPSLEGRVIARAPGGTCAITTAVDTDLTAEWLPVTYETGHVRKPGFVSNEFVDQKPEELEFVVLEWAQAVLDGRDRTPWQYDAYLAGVDTSSLEGFRGATAVPYVDVSGHTCRIVGDVTIACGVQVNDGDHRPVSHLIVYATVVGANGYEGEPYFPPDFGDLPLVVGFESCVLFERCGDVDFATIAIDSDASLRGVALGAPADSAIEDLGAVLGSPTADSGWIVGCPLDGDGLNERYVEWGGLTAAFSRLDGGDDGEFWHWYYDLGGDYESLGLEQRLRYPGRLAFPSQTEDISAATRLPIEIHEILGDPVIYGPGWTLIAEQKVTAILRYAAVPFLSICD